MAALIEKIKELMGYLDRDTMARACRKLQFSIGAVVAVDGNFLFKTSTRYILLLSFFNFIEIGSFSSVLCSLKKKLSKCPDLSVPPCIYLCALHVCVLYNNTKTVRAKRITYLEKY